MERRMFLAAIVLAWLALPLTALHYQRTWERLPARVAVHFDANWQANGWTSRKGSRTLALGITAFLLTIFTLAGLAVSRVATPAWSKWVMVFVFYVVLGIVFYVNYWIVERSLNGPQPAGVSQVIVDSDLRCG
jgi:hypothetical protein